MKTRTISATLMAAFLLESLDAYKLPSCGAANCLPDGLFYTCDPSDLKCLCTQPQNRVDEYVRAVKPCLESEERKASCTDGALFQYKDLLVTVCESEGKSVQW
ncbi:hypothetical protein K504DRAFT_465151 [Pleomassaria siparia CBS 279.74]|uniref:CFEM domain-containing protein n=1 Tax=Pleomassaria siparia CBS 279.74 TaxID=1314801 RepID=A0A6G1KGA4_9PLEO|nr:hypothetical protein K504DRAFT_465151 [Pleomassaria siparia CBS 279.74]